MSGHAVLAAQRVEDCVIDQAWERYSPEDHAVWRILFERQRATLSGHICQEYLDGLDALGIGPEGVPAFERMNKRLRRLTGWEVVAVPGLIPSRPFFQMLADRQFPAGTFIRCCEDELREAGVLIDNFGGDGQRLPWSDKIAVFHVARFFEHNDAMGKILSSTHQPRAGLSHRLKHQPVGRGYRSGSREGVAYCRPSAWRGRTVSVRGAGQVAGVWIGWADGIRTRTGPFWRSTA